MKTVCIYHSIDLDGWMSAAIVKHWFIIQHRNNCCITGIDNLTELSKTKSNILPENQLVLIGYNYGQPIPDLSEYDKVIMCDISFSAKEMEYIGEKLLWIDHHISAIKDSESMGYDMSNGLRDTKFSACELTWKYFFPNEQMPEIVRLLGRYDCFGYMGTDEQQEVLEFQYGARQCISNYKEAYAHLVDEGMNYKTPELNTLNIILDKGKSIYKYLCTEAKQAYKNGFDIEFFSHVANIDIDTPSKRKFKFICINKERFNPTNFGIDYHADGYDGAACFHFDGKVYNFSLYNDNGLVDCSIIAKQFGGGDHKGAAGFRLTQEQFNNLINK